MSLTKEQISHLKKQLLDQIKNLPIEQREEAEAQIEEMSDESIELMLQNQKDSQIKIFREIVSGKVPSKKIDESNEAIAVLDIKPISKGHTIIIPKDKIEDTEKIPKTILDFSETIANKLRKILNPKEIKIIKEIKFGEAIINLVPFYDNSSLENKVDHSEDELDKVLSEINTKSIKEDKKEVQEVKPPVKEELKKFKRRIP